MIDDNEVADKRMRPSGHSVLFAQIIRLHRIEGKKPLLSRNIYEPDCMRWYNHLRRQGKYDNNGNSWYFRFDDDNKKSYEWASSTHTNLHIATKIRKVTERTNYILDTLSIEYT